MVCNFRIFLYFSSNYQTFTQINQKGKQKLEPRAPPVSEIKREGGGESSPALLARGDRSRDAPQRAAQARLPLIASSRKEKCRGKQTRLRGDKDGRASAEGEVRRRPTRGVAGDDAGLRYGRTYDFTGDTVTEWNSFEMI